MEYAVAAQIITNWKECTDLTQKVAYLVGNYSRGVYAQKRDTGNELDTNIKEHIFSLFSSLLNRWVIFIIKLKAQTEENTTHAQASQLDLSY